MKILLKSKLCLLYVLTITLVLCTGSPADMSEDQDFVWVNGLRQMHFGDREIIESDTVIVLKAPKLAEDAAYVPLKISAGFAQSPERYIKTISLFIDQNPGPLVGRFHFTPKSGRADLALRARVNTFTPVRAIAETSDGKLYMSRQFVRASGGCSIPINQDLTGAMQRLGKMKLRTLGLVFNQPTGAQLNISHPNITGLQMDRHSKVYLPPHFVQFMSVRFNGEVVMQAETDIAISTDPSFRFYFVPDQPGELSVEIEDNQARKFTRVFPVQARQ